ncbi:uncharacterized protein LOC121721038 [Alosa sapidissima]|uniref:uncharacterized protein LOC121721038 n=1 Tax=Alosa sapidissima TaxID=34773 RepID=UPI001C085920|nr:uncharacterized protein LOC121721038 [Alosa sapidissima]
MVEDVHQWAEKASVANSPLQDKIESLFLSIKQRKMDLYRHNDTNKFRNRIRKKIEGDRMTLKRLILQYNSTPLVEQLDIGGVMANLASNAPAVQLWPWSGGDTCNLLEKKKVFDVAMARLRLEEEKAILEGEMAQHSASLKAEAEAVRREIHAHRCRDSLDETCSHLCLLRSKLAQLQKHLEVVCQAYMSNAAVVDPNDNEEQWMTNDTDEDESGGDSDGNNDEECY